MWKAFCIELNTINLEARSIIKWWKDKRDLQEIQKNRQQIEKLNHKINVLVAQEKMYYSLLHLLRVLTEDLQYFNFKYFVLYLRC